jgi:hypothetical protein
MRYETNSVKSTSSRSRSFSARRRPGKRSARPAMAPPRKLTTTRRPNSLSNQYRCSMERNQSGKQSVRIRAHFARQHWDMSVYFVASSHAHAMQKLEQCLRFLQRNEERLWFWGVDRSDDPNFAAELLGEAGLKLDRRMEFPRRSAMIAIAPDRILFKELLAPVRQEFSKLAGNLRAGSD